MLHLIFKSPIDLAIIERLAQGDAAVFLESAVLCTLQKGKFANALKNKLGSNRFYVLSEDMEMRGISNIEIVAGLEVIDYSRLVKLTTEHSPIQSWC